MNPSLWPAANNKPSFLPSYISELQVYRGNELVSGKEKNSLFLILEHVFSVEILMKAETVWG